MSSCKRASVDSISCIRYKNIFAHDGISYDYVVLPAHINIENSKVTDYGGQCSSIRC